MRIRQPELRRMLGAAAFPATLAPTPKASPPDASAPGNRHLHDNKNPNATGTMPLYFDRRVVPPHPPLGGSQVMNFESRTTSGWLFKGAGMDFNAARAAQMSPANQRLLAFWSVSSATRRSRRLSSRLVRPRALSMSISTTAFIRAA